MAGCFLEPWRGIDAKILSGWVPCCLYHSLDQILSFSTKWILCVLLPLPQLSPSSLFYTIQSVIQLQIAVIILAHAVLQSWFAYITVELEKEGSLKKKFVNIFAAKGWIRTVHKTTEWTCMNCINNKWSMVISNLTYKSASPPHIDGSVVFARWRQCAAHI